MSDNNLTTKNPGDVIASEDPNQYKSALDGNLVPRDTSGIPTDLAGSLGTTLLRWFRLFVQKITLGDPDDDVHIEQTAGVLTIKINDIVKFLLDSNGFDGTNVSEATKLRIQSVNFSTAGAGTWESPVSGYVLLKSLGGGGGGGGGGNAGTGDGGGGAGCAFSMVPYFVVKGTIYNFTIATGGLGGPTNTGGAAGGDTIFDGVTICKGADGGTANVANAIGGRGSASYYKGGNSANSTEAIRPGERSSRFNAGAYTTAGGEGGASDLANGGAGGTGVVAGQPGSLGSGGGGGSGADSTPQAHGGNGGDGYLQIDYIDFD